jgi:hypothetical protein
MATVPPGAFTIDGILPMLAVAGEPPVASGVGHIHAIQDSLADLRRVRALCHGAGQERGQGASDQECAEGDGGVPGDCVGGAEGEAADRGEGPAEERAG